MTTPTTDNRQPTTAPDKAAAIRHAVYHDLLGFLPVASYDQAREFVGNLGLCGDWQKAVRDANDYSIRIRRENAALMRFLGLKVTPDIAETKFCGATAKEIERWLNKKYREYLQHVAGFHRLENDGRAFRLNLPWKCAAYGYRSATGFYNGILFQPLDRLNSYFLLSSSKYGGPKAIGLTPRDQQYFTQFEEVSL